MKRIPEETIEQIRSNVNIVEIVSQYVQLHKSGKNYFGLCPFHEEKTPSFSVTDEKQIFHCFSCHRGGNVFKFIMEMEKISFPEAVIKVAELGGIALPASITEDGSASDQADTQTGQLRQIYALSADLFHHILVNTAIGEPALNYLHQRGLSDETIETFYLGFAPTQQVLLPFLKDRNFSRELLVRSGLFSEGNDGSLYQRFKERVLFPIRDPQKRVIAFSGRLLTKDDQLPKYLNSPETVLFNKRKVLFNFDLAKGEIRQQGFAILFEGFMDVISAYQAGVHQGVASMGTSLTNEQIYLLERTTERLCLCYDGDSPGQKATARALQLLQPLTKLELGVIPIPNQRDPDEYINQESPAAFVKLVENGQQNQMSFWFSFLATERNLTNENDQLAYISDVLEKIAGVASPVARDLYLGQLAKRFSLDKKSLAGQLHSLLQQQARKNFQQQTRQPVPLARKAAPAAKNYDRVEKAERLLLYRLLHSYDVRLKLRETTNFAFVHDSYQTIYLLAEGYFKQYADYDPARFLDFLADEHLRQLMVELEVENHAAVGSAEEVDDCMRLIMQLSPLEEQLAALKQQLETARRMNNQKLVEELTIKFVELLKQRQLKKSASL
ncbi:MAG: DNA primase [Liquorilactobacillus ghanensis]|uniref:DNA primase n=1 Tax=Liquorilactobacillus ghanensis TaxID=399370 RepID=UPI0039ECB7E2